MESHPPGDALDLTLTVATADRSKTAFNIVSVQAGYRLVRPGVADHPYFRKLMAQAAASGNTACTTNYMCQVTPANAPAGAEPWRLLSRTNFNAPAR